MNFKFVYITAKDKNEGMAIGRTLVAERLAACANIFDGMTSIYQWQEKTEESREAVLIAKTKEENLDRLIKRVKELHSYECPCIVSVPIEKGYAPYLQWLADSTET